MHSRDRARVLFKRTLLTHKIYFNLRRVACSGGGNSAATSSAVASVVAAMAAATAGVDDLDDDDDDDDMDDNFEGGGNGFGKAVREKERRQANNVRERYVMSTG